MGGWLPFKGCCEAGESFEQTAIREVLEETCYLVKLDNIDLHHTFATHRKIYKIGLCEIPFDFINQFRAARKKETREKCKEKYEVRFFYLDTALANKMIHPITKQSIEFYWNNIIYSKPKLTRRLSEPLMYDIPTKPVLKTRSRSETIPIERPQHNNDIWVKFEKNKVTVGMIVKIEPYQNNYVQNMQPVMAQTDRAINHNATKIVVEPLTNEVANDFNLIMSDLLNEIKRTLHVTNPNPWPKMQKNNDIKHTVLPLDYYLTANQTIKDDLVMDDFINNIVSHVLY